MRISNLERAVEAMVYLQEGQPYSLHPDDKKRKLLDEVSRLCREMKLSPVVIGGLAVSHHGYIRTTRDVDVLLGREEGMALVRRLKTELGWKRYAEGFLNTVLEVGLDIRVEGQKTSLRGDEKFPNPSNLRTVRVQPIPVVALTELIALKVMSARAQDDADVVNLFKVHRRGLASLSASAAGLLKTAAAKAHLKSLVGRAKEELGR